jgi:hypothetical protein
LLREINSQNVRVFVIWEPVLATDFVAPSTAALARIADARAAQYWERKRALSHLLGERNRSTVVWDCIAVYAPGTLWQDAPGRGWPIKLASRLNRIRASNELGNPRHDPSVRLLRRALDLRAFIAVLGFRQRAYEQVKQLPDILL